MLFSVSLSDVYVTLDGENIETIPEKDSFKRLPDSDLVMS